MTPTSLSYNMIDLGNRTISTVNVGEVYLAYFQKDSQKLATLKADLLGLGSQREIKVTPRKIILTPDDLLIYLNKQFVSFYGFERLKSFLVSVGEASLETVAAALKEDFIMALGEKKLPRDVLVLFLRVD